MKADKDKFSKCLGFTIIELLTVMGIIAILIGLLVPALNLVKDYTKELEQKAQFHSIEAALGMFSSEDRYGRYPESNDNMDRLDPTKDNRYDIPLGVPYCGANKLAEAIVGLDFLGFHPNSDFRSNNTFSHPLTDGTMQHDAPTYHADPATPPYEPALAPLYWETSEENVKARWGPFVELENANAFMVTDIYDQDAIGGPGIGDFDPDRANLVLCDVFTQKRRAGKKTGMPILYYKARTHFVQQDWVDLPGGSPYGIADDIYYYMDNYNLLALGSAENPGNWHPLANGLPGDGGDITAGSPDYTSEDDWRDFENMILNPQITTIKRPYRAGSYILMSAGKDGLYGTPDDIFNFDKE